MLKGECEQTRIQDPDTILIIDYHVLNADEVLGIPICVRRV
jgi:hypothetical protein